MQINSATYDFYTHKVSSGASKGTLMTEASAPLAAEGAPKTESKLFSNGKFIGAAELTSPATLGALFQMNEDGTVMLTDLGSPVTQKGVFLETPRDMMTKFLMLGSESSWTISDRAVASDLAKITDDDKAIFREVTGYNLFISGLGMMIVDDEGNVPPESESGPINELFNRMRFARENDQKIDSGWFKNVSNDIANWDGPMFPADWADRADAWFNQLTEARRQAVEIAKRPSPVEIATAGFAKSDLDAAMGAYWDASGLAKLSAARSAGRL